jgi:hypothetical protein
VVLKLNKLSEPNLDRLKPILARKGNRSDFLEGFMVGAITLFVLTVAFGYFETVGKVPEQDNFYYVCRVK